MALVIKNNITQPSLYETVLPENLPRELAHNGMRDPTWTVISTKNINLVGREMPALVPTSSIHCQIVSGAFVQPMAAQWLFGTAPMLLFATGETIYRKAKGEKLDVRKIAEIWAPPAAASLAIPMWDLGQVIGNHIGHGISSPLYHGASLAGGLVAAPFAGVFEGFTHWGVKYLADVATDPVKRQTWRDSPLLMIKLLIKELLLNTTIGAIPGAVWQVVFFFVLPVLMATLGPWGGILLTALLVGLAVMAMNFVCSHVITKVSSAIDRAMGWDQKLSNAVEKAKQAIEAQKQKQQITAAHLQLLKA